MGKLNTHNLIYCMKIIERIDWILHTHSTECTWQYFQVRLHNDDKEVVYITPHGNIYLTTMTKVIFQC